VLDLAEGPVVRVHDLLEDIEIVVEGKTQVADAAIAEGLTGPFAHTQVAHLVPAALIQGVQQVKVNVVGLQLFELLVEQPVEILGGLDQPARQLGGQPHLFTIAILEHPPDDPFAVAAVVAIRRVHVIHAVVNGVVQHTSRLRLVNVLGLPCGREPHTAEPQCRNLPVRLSELSVLHTYLHSALCSAATRS
jgi:hypothetical protein